MENTHQHLPNKIVLSDRTLWFDGDSTVKSDKISKLLAQGISSAGLFVDELNDSIRQYNQLVSPSERIQIKNDTKPLDFCWNIPQEYLQIDVKKFCLSELEREILENQFGNEQTDLIRARVNRVILEYNLYEKAGLVDILKVLIYIINTLKEKNVVWGVGRGSSVSSYILYLIGVHDVDSVLYDLDVTDFIKITDNHD